MIEARTDQDRKRIDRLAAGLTEAGLDALAIVADSNADPDLAPFAGAARLGRAALVVTASAAVRLGFATPMEREEAARTGWPALGPEILGVAQMARQGAGEAEILGGVLEGLLASAGLESGRVGLAGCRSAGVVWDAGNALVAKGWRLTGAQQLLVRARRGKLPWELESVRGAAAGQEAAFHAVAELLAGAEPVSLPGSGSRSESARELTHGGSPLTVGRLKAAVAEVYARHGLSQPEGGIVAPGEEGAVPHNSGRDDRRLRLGESIVVDLFPKAQLFLDSTRTFCCGEPPPALQQGWSQTLEALRRARAAVAIGISGWDLQRDTCAFFEQQAVPTLLSDPLTERGYVHGLGHGVGFQVHELPVFTERAGMDGVLADGDLITLEPGIYEPEAGWAVRLEDFGVVTDCGFEQLVALPYEMDPRAWVSGA